MMKNYFLLTLFCLGFLVSFAQSRDVQIYWDRTSPNESRTAIKSPVDASGDIPIQLGLEVSKERVSFSTKWMDQGFANPSSLQITNTKWESLTSKELQKINRDLIPSALQYNISSNYGRDIIYTQLQISPIVNRNGQLQKLTSFRLNYTYGRNSQNIRMLLQNSVLASGNWYKFRVEKTGIYRITKDFLNNLGMDVDNIDPRNLKIYSNGGKPLPLLNSENTIFDLPENTIKVIGEQDGNFDENDFILFYGIGVEGYDAENDTHLNPYSDESYYYITANGGPGLRVQPMVEPEGAPNFTIDQFQENQFVEEDLFSPAKVGRQWYGSRFDIESQQSFEFTFPNIVPSSEVSVKVKAAAASEVNTSMAITLNNTAVNPLEFNGVTGSSILNDLQTTNTFNASGETITVNLNYNNSGNPSSVGYLDYISVNAIRSLQGNGGQLPFYNDVVEDPLGVVEYQISNASQFSEVWDVTDYRQITFKVNEGNSGNFAFKANSGALRKYVAVNPNDYYSPVTAANNFVPNQDLKGTIFNDASGNFTDIDYIIVTPAFLIQPALKLASHHKNINNYNVKVVTLDKIYTEFSSGKQDIGAIRNFVRYVYENASSPAKRLKYLCLFGDTSVDYKNRLFNNNNIVPTFHTRSSVNTFSDFMSDDFFVVLDPDEGLVTDNNNIDVAVGRILADDVSLANAMVDKAIDYESKVSYGNWRNNFVLISDDVDEPYEYTQLEKVLDSIGDRVTAEKPYINVKKIHTDAFQQETSAGGNRYPSVNEAVVEAIEVGALIVNYFGHGGEDGLAKEFIYTKEAAQNLQNENKYTCLVTVTCELTKFDNPQRITAGELTYWNREGGAVSLITTTRSIGVNLGVDFNRQLNDVLFGIGTDNPLPPSESLMVVKNNISNNNKRVIFYVGDPALRLAFPKQSVRITHLNDQPISQAADTLKALSKVKFRGEVVDASGNLLSNYNGVVEPKVFDKDVMRQTLANDGTRDDINDRDGDGDTNNILYLYFKTLGETLFNGQATVTNGVFEFEFVVPKDIQIPVGNGKISLYSERNNALEDQTGFNLDILVGGINENAPEDTQGPLINLFMNDESFVSGGVTNDSPFLIAKLEDENGINTASGIGHDITAILDGDEANPFVLNEYYQAEVDDFTRGEAAYKLRDLEEGLHTLTLKAWDVYNNSSTAEIQFIVAGDDKLEITRVLNYPNPFVNYTEFWFNHNRPFEPLEVQVQVFTVTGKIVWTQNQIVNTDGFLSREITWNGKDDFGDRIGKGVYVYKLTVKSTLTGQQVEKFEKLVIL